MLRPAAGLEPGNTNDRRDGTAAQRSAPPTGAFPLLGGDQDLPVLGPYRLSRRLAEGPSGIVWLGTDAAGNEVSVIAIWPHAAAVPGALDRLRAMLAREAAEAAPARAPVVAADLDSALPWIATPYDGRIGAERFVDRWDRGFAPPPFPSGPPPGPPPGFAGFPGGFRPSAPSAPGARRRRAPGALWVGLAALAVLAVIAIAHLLAQELKALNGPTPPPSQARPAPPAQVLHTGMGFSLRLPAGWSCTGSAAQGWYCSGEGSSLELSSRPCPGACGPVQQRRLLAASGMPVGRWRSLGLDAWGYQAVGDQGIEVDLITFWNPEGGLRPNTEVLALGSAPLGRGGAVRGLEEQVRLATA